MLTLAKALLALSAWCFMSISAHAQDMAALRQRMVEINGFVRAETGYKKTALPKVIFKTAAELNKIKGLLACEAKDTKCLQVPAVEDGGVMFLSTGFKLGLDDDILVHELTHFQQFESGRPFRCDGAKEAEAYKIQNLFIKEAGMKGHLPGPLVMMMATKCGEE